MGEEHIPVIVVSGFLGSGKTTLLNNLLRDPRLSDTAVIVNEFGEIGLDHLLVESALDEMILMDNGCLCCSVRGDLVDTLTDLLSRVEKGEIPKFQQVMIETTGLADPGPIAQTLASNADLAGRFTLKGIVVTVDGVNGVESLDAFDEARTQAALADLVLLTKADRPEANIAGVRAAVRAINPGAPVMTIEEGGLDPEVILSLDPTDVTPLADLPDDHDHSDESGRHRHGHDHDSVFQTASIVFDAPIAWRELARWAEWITAMRGPDILRMKGLVEVEGIPGPVLIHGVQHVFYPSKILEDWPDSDHRSRVTVIARDVPERAIRASFDLFRSQGRGRPPCAQARQ